MNYIEPQNPLVKILVEKNKGRRYVALSCLPKYEKNRCKWCMKAFSNIRKHYCSSDCSKSAWAFCYPQKYAHELLMQRQNDKCNHCGYNFKDHIKKFNVSGVEYTDMGEVDHIVPISQGGDSLGVHNIQLLCKDCHREKSANERKKEN